MKKKMMKSSNRDRTSNSKQALWMVHKSMRDITSHSISVAATPYDVAMNSGTPYPIIAAQNKIIDSSYAGEDNITGNSLIEIVNNPQSGYLQSIDLAKIRMALKYNYMAINADDKNVAVNVEYNKAMQEALANAFAETFTDLPFFKYSIKTEMPGCGDPLNDNDPKRILAFATFYQTVQQNIMHCAASYNLALSMEEFLYQQAWLREVPQLKQLYGLLKKTSLLAVVQALVNYIPGCALDTSWLTQTNILCNVPCKRSDSFDDPLIVVSRYTEIPEITVSVGGTRIFKYSEYDNDSDYMVTVGNDNFTLTELTSAIGEALSPYNIQMWARQAYAGESVVSARDYFNTLVDLLNGMVQLLSRFPSDMADFDVVLKVMNRAGLNNWQYQITPSVGGVTQYRPVFNKLLYDVIAARCSGGSAMTFDENTRRWKFFTVWDRVTDMPEYDMKSGGAFLAFSLRDLPTDADYTTTKWLIPILFTLEANIVVADRTGFETEMSYVDLNYSDISTDPVLARVVPLSSMTDAELRLPIVNVSLNTDHLISAASYALKFLMKLCGMGAVIYEHDGSTVRSVGLDSTIQNMLDEQMIDISNKMINQARVSAPFRVAVAKDVRSIGFVKVVS